MSSVPGGRFRAGRWSSVALLLGALSLAGCPDRMRRQELAAHVAGGDPRQGARLARAFGCGDCHVIPGVRGANALVGPPLTHWSQRAYIAGLVPNTPENLVAWLRDPQQIHPRSAMPNTGLSPDQARHVAAYLYTIR